jgi:hypothetical protein
VLILIENKNWQLEGGPREKAPLISTSLRVACGDDNASERAGLSGRRLEPP